MDSLWILLWILSGIRSKPVASLELNRRQLYWRLFSPLRQERNYKLKYIHTHTQSETKPELQNSLRPTGSLLQQIHFSLFQLYETQADFWRRWAVQQTPQRLRVIPPPLYCRERWDFRNSLKPGNGSHRWVMGWRGTELFLGLPKAANLTCPSRLPSSFCAAQLSCWLAGICCFSEAKPLNLNSKKKIDMNTSKVIDSYSCILKGTHSVSVL